jgi:hypothetical protein
MKLEAITALIVASMLGMACSTTQNLTLVSTRNVDLSAPHDIAARGEKASSGRFWLLFIPFAGEPNGVATATKLLEKHEGDYLTNVEVTSTGWSLLVFSWGSVSVKGDVYRRAVQPPTISPIAAPSATPAAEPVSDTAEEPAAETLTEE